MTLETKLGDIEMGFWNKHKKKIAGPLVAGMITTGVLGGVDKNHRGDISFGTSSAVATQGRQASANYQRPGAIEAEQDQALRTAWDYMHDKNLNGWKEKNLSSKQMTAALLKMADHGALYMNPISEDTFNTSFGYRLLVAKVSRSWGNYPGQAPAENRGLNYFDSGVSNLFKQNNITARRDFARGVFVSANLVEKDYKTLQNLGIDVKYDNRATIEGNALNLAQMFIDLDLSRKERMLSVVAEKFKNVKVDESNTNWNSPEYKKKSIYINYGFFILADYGSGQKQEALSLRNASNSFYKNMFNEFKYDSANNKLL